MEIEQKRCDWMFKDRKNAEPRMAPSPWVASLLPAKTGGTVWKAGDWS